MICYEEEIICIDGTAKHVFAQGSGASFSRGHLVAEQSVCGTDGSSK